MNLILRGFLSILAFAVSFSSQVLFAGTLVNPYVQNPAVDAMTICWVTESGEPGKVTVRLPEGPPIKTVSSMPSLQSALDYGPSEREHLPGGIAPHLPYLHRVRIEGLKPGTTYRYTVRQGNEMFSRTFRTAPEADDSIRFIVYADSETEPESTGKPVDWPRPHSPGRRLYVVDQTEGYRQNLRVIEERAPDFIAIAGDLVEKGGRQLDWDEFWRHNAGQWGDIAGSIPILPAIGNHENYAGPDGGYTVAGARRGIGKFQAYFETPDNGSGNTAFEDRFYRIDYGPITWITLDSSDGAPDKSEGDSNFFLQGEHDGGDAPDFNPGSVQYKWLERQLAEAQDRSRFTFVQFHHSPYSIGPHGFPAGEGKGYDTQSGQPLRVLSPLFEKYGVDAVFCGHDEIYEHSLVGGVHYFDVGIGGDGLRGPYNGEDGSSGLPSTNPHQVFLAHLHAPEVWKGRRLISGGKHYGHMEVNVSPDADGSWTATLTPVHIFPLMDASGKVTGWERRTYDDEAVLRR